MEIGQKRTVVKIAQSGENKGKKRYDTQYWVICNICGQGRWASKGRGLPAKCSACARKTYQCSPETKAKIAQYRGEKHHRWGGGRYKNYLGYWVVRLSSDDFFYPMVSKPSNRVFEHRLVMAKHLNRCLLPWEIVHHKNGIKGDNRIENLELLPSNTKHAVITKMQQYIDKLERELEKLRRIVNNA